MKPFTSFTVAGTALDLQYKLCTKFPFNLSLFAKRDKTKIRGKCKGFSILIKLYSEHFCNLAVQNFTYENSF